MVPDVGHVPTGTHGGIHPSLGDPVPGERLIHAKLDTIAALVGSIYQQLGQLVSDVNRLQLQGQTQEQRDLVAKQAKERYEKLKEEAEEEVQALLRKRHEAGIGDGGNALTESDLMELD